jgi:threonine dehydratase
MLKNLPLPLNIVDVRAAAVRIQSHIICTPLLESPYLNAMIGGRLLVKAESLQRTGSFKIRGAFNTLLQLSDAERENGVLAYSSGNHAQGVACAAKSLGIKATILMPEDAPKVKVENTKSYGATVIHFNRYTESREEIGEKLAEINGTVLVKPYDDSRVIAGQGTIGLEIVEQLHELGLTPDTVVAPCGGGGLIAGLSLAIKSEFPTTNIYSAEPEHYDDMALSLLAKRIISVEACHKTICDAVMTPKPGELTFSIICNLLKSGLVVKDSETRNAMRHAFNRLKLVVEPGGCVALAALLSKKIDARDNTVVVVCSGGNVDATLFSEVLTG